MKLGQNATVLLTLGCVTLALGLALPDLPGLAWPALAAATLLLLNYTGLLERTRLSARASAVLALMAGGLALIALPTSAIRAKVVGWMTVYADRQRLQREIAIFPQARWGDRPQRLLLRAASSHQLRLSWKGGEVDPVSLGAGLFRWDYDPRKQGLPTPVDGRVTVSVRSDGDGSRELRLAYFAPVVRPGMLSSDPVAGVAATVSEPTNEVLVATRSGKVQRFPVGWGPSCCALFDHSRSLAVGHRYDQSVWIVDSRTGHPRETATLGGMVENLAISPDETRLAVLYEGVKPGLAIFELPGLRPLRRVETEHPGELLCFGRSRDELIVASRRHRCLFRVGTNQVKMLSLPATALCRGPAGRTVTIATTSGQVNGQPQQGNHYVENVLMTLDLASWSWREVRSTEERSENQQLAGSVDRGCGASDLKLLGDNRWLAVFSGTHELATLPLDHGLEGHIDTSESDLFCPVSAAELGQDVLLVSYPAQGILAWVNSSAEVLRRVELAPKDDQLSSAALARRQGEICFYEATNAGISCQSCHTRGDSDYGTHNIGGLRMWNTLSLDGIAGTAPYLRDASYPDLMDLHSVANLEYRGYRRETKYDRASVIAQWIESRPLPGNPRQLLSGGLAAERRGLQAFIKADCVQCHALPALTNLASVPNQTLFPVNTDYYELLDVPSLRGVWRSAPFLHDGRARTLQDVLVAQNSADQHGRVKQLTPSERADLIRFLESL